MINIKYFPIVIINVINNVKKYKIRYNLYISQRHPFKINKYIIIYFIFPFDRSMVLFEDDFLLTEVLII